MTPDASLPPADVQRPTTPPLTEEATLTVRFKVSCRASFGGPVMRRMWSDLHSPPPQHETTTAIQATWSTPPTWPGHDAAEAFGRRLKAANACHGFDLDESRCVLSPKRITLVGTARFIRDRRALNAGDAVPSVLALLRFTLRSVYGHDIDVSRSSLPIPGLSLTVAEVPL